MASIHLIKRGKVWVPADEHAEKWTDKQPDGGEVVFERKATKADPKEMRRYFAMLRVVIENQEVYKDQEELRAALLIATGYYAWKRDFFGRLYEHPNSMAEMDTETLLEHKKRALKLIGEQLHIDPVELMREADGTQKWSGPLP